jgi:hypothetical protein
MRSCDFEELDAQVSALRRAIAEVKQRWSAIGLVTKNLLYRALCIGRHVKPVSAVFAPTNLYWARVVGYGPLSLCLIH